MHEDPHDDDDDDDDPIDNRLLCIAPHMLATFTKSKESNGGPSMLTHIRVLVVVLLRRSVLILFILENVCSQAAIQEVLNDPQIK